MAYTSPLYGPTTVLKSASPPAGAPLQPNIQPPQSEAEQPRGLQAPDMLIMTQVQDLSAKDLRFRWEMNELVRRSLEEESVRLRAKFEELQRRETDLAAKTAEVQRAQAKSEADLTEAMEEKGRASKLATDAERIAGVNKKKEEELKQAEDRINQLRLQEAKINKDKDDAEKARKEAASDLKAAEDARAETDAKLQQAKELKDQIANLESQSWPQWLRDGAWYQWRSALLAKAKLDGNAALVVAAFHRFCAAEKAVDSALEIASALQDLGSRLYRCYPTEDKDIAQIGKAFNESAKGRFLLKFARVGDPTADQWMNYQPGRASVSKVLNWAVYKPGVTPGSPQIIASKAVVE